ncbi:hypothetical protein [Luteimonas panaciterrae]|uniref:hypothetical protein n=1 Tax=Luteimonas panaciterrae TaxID=363885 RepID=UPI001CF9D385|nr:hypothetical protein [Luteimonas panaciterrae]
MIRKRIALLLIAGAVLLLLLAIALRFVLQPDRVAGFTLSAIGNALGLEINAAGTNEYQLLGGPQLVVRNVTVREPGATTPLLRAQRVLVSVPWSTVRSRGEKLDITRLELDAPILDVQALQHWLSTRPSGETSLPTFSNGVQVDNGRVEGGDWRIEAFSLALPRLQPDRRIDARAGGRFGTETLSLQFNLAVAMTRPASGAGVAVVGPITAQAKNWRLPARLRASGPLYFDDGVRIVPLRASLVARYESGDTRLPFAFALNSPLRYRDDVAALAPAGLALRGEGVVPNLDASGVAAYGKRMLLRFDGRLAAWPRAWPALPAPLNASQSPLGFSTRYLGAADLSDPAELHLQRDATRFDGRFRIPEITQWVAAATGTAAPLPPLSGHLTTPELVISGARLEGIEIELDDAEPKDAKAP